MLNYEIIMIMSLAFPFGSLKRFNPYDRAPLNTVPATEIPTFYRAYGRLIKIISDPVGHFWHRLKPGQVIFIDNWRVMHGRSAFAGTRVMCGCYLPRDEWVSKARMLGVWWCDYFYHCLIKCFMYKLLKLLLSLTLKMTQRSLRNFVERI